MEQKFPTGRVLFWAAVAIGASVVQSTGFTNANQNETAETGVVLQPGDNAAIEDARREARRELPTFLKIAKSGAERWDGVSLKVAIPVGDSFEHIWITEFSRANGTGYEGRVSNPPKGHSDLQSGDRIEFVYDQIDDFGFVQDGMGYGFFSVRAILPMLDRTQAASYRSFLSTDPLPSYW